MTVSQRRKHAQTRIMLGIALICAALLFRPDISRAQEHVGYAMGGCGGLMTGYDGRQYRCAQDRLPVCNQNRQQCVCLARRECGAAQNEPY
jgi:hypothetical protein